jgi:protein-disulfide isomerase
MIRLVLAAAAMLAVAPGAAQQAKAPAAAARDWTTSVVATPEGGYRVGNPAAPVKLIEYASLTCGTCARFARDGKPKLMAGPVKSGRVSYELRNYVRDPADVTAALLSRCGGAARYFPLTDAILLNQERWVKALTALPQAQMTELNGLPTAQRFGRIATLSGLDALAVRGGVPAARAKQCLADPKALAQLVELNRVAQTQYQLQGTPTFLINGVKANAHDWAGLEPLLAKAVR